jgi:hypothetical protein
MPFTYIKDTTNQLYVCPECGIHKKNQNTMHYHIKKHKMVNQENNEMNSTNSCKICKKNFLQKHTLDLHIRSKHPEFIKSDPNLVDLKIKCPFDNCNFTSLTKGNCIIHVLRLHFTDEIGKIMIKEDSKNIKCANCYKNFSNTCGFYYHCKECVVFNKNDIKYKLLEKVL